VRGVGIEERSFVAKSAPLDDGQKRVGDGSEITVTIKRLSMRRQKNLTLRKIGEGWGTRKN
jgi:hypothetical protein